MQWAVSAQLVGTTRDYTRAVAPLIERFAELAYQAGAEKGKADYEREHLRHTIPLPDALRVMQEQIAEACAKAANEVCATNRVLIAIRSGEWRKYMEGKP